ncbi:hypothetical protein BDY17DRAFT_48856 [Neohortaea acidophila]|uniref:Uncharacterized protein n=1 Tax=Neohortaea acidophila TaxID=245834 RepID=A0A6A6PH33_9PEZI|nr:uncharacterized protein BDY17DRAFT_48856 [Neohortaea acidophila]KAF2479086.1 hypothetical protein BDY17DRAFT_48856 [Neohortaea acidophila]
MRSSWMTPRTDCSPLCPESSGRKGVCCLMKGQLAKHLTGRTRGMLLCSVFWCPQSASAAYLHHRHSSCRAIMLLCRPSERSTSAATRAYFWRPPRQTRKRSPRLVPFAFATRRFCSMLVSWQSASGARCFDYRRCMYLRRRKLHPLRRVIGPFHPNLFRSLALRVRLGALAAISLSSNRPCPVP